MDWKIFTATFVAIFFAELADKTQLVGLSMASESGKPWVVLLGSVAAYCVITAFSVFLGAALGKFIKPDLIRSVGALLFIVIGLLMFFKKI